MQLDFWIVLLMNFMSTWKVFVLSRSVGTSNLYQTVQSESSMFTLVVGRHVTRLLERRALEDQVSKEKNSI